MAIPLFDSAANSIGHMGVMHVEPTSGTVSRESILRVFAARAAAELERSQAAQTIHLSVERRSLVDTICQSAEEIDKAGISRSCARMSSIDYYLNSLASAFSTTGAIFTPTNHFIPKESDFSTK